MIATITNTVANSDVSCVTGLVCLLPFLEVKKHYRVSGNEVCGFILVQTVCSVFYCHTLGSLVGKGSTMIDKDDECIKRDKKLGLCRGGKCIRSLVVSKEQFQGAWIQRCLCQRRIFQTGGIHYSKSKKALSRIDVDGRKHRTVRVGSLFLKRNPVIECSANSDTNLTNHYHSYFLFTSPRFRQCRLDVLVFAARDGEIAVN